MAVEEIGFDDLQSRAGVLCERPSIQCHIPQEEKHHLFHQIGVISRFIRDRFLFPLISATDSNSKKILERENWISSELFWNSSYNDIRYPKHQQIKETFNRYDQYIVIKECGKEIKVKCRILETKDCPKDAKNGVLNHLIVQGNLSTLDNNIPALYPFLASYVTQKEKNPELPPARFIMINHYHNTVKEEGSVAYRTFDAVKDFFGCVTQSLKSTMLASPLMMGIGFSFRALSLKNRLIISLALTAITNLFLATVKYSNMPTKGAVRTYLPGDMDEWTYVFKKSLESVVDTYGSLELISAHSLGNIPVVGHLKHVKEHEFTKLFPKVLLLSQGPSSSYEVSKNVPFQTYPKGWCFLLGAFVYYVTKWSGWDINLDANLTDFMSGIPQTKEANDKLQNTKIVITEVDKDYYFPGKASLCASDRLDKIDSRVSLYRMSFSPPLSWGVQRGHHNFNMGLLQRQDLVREALHLQGEKTIHLDSPKKIVEYEVDHPMLLKHGENVVDSVLKGLWKETLDNQSASLQDRVSVVAV